MVILRLVAVFLVVLVPFYFASTYYTETRDNHPLKDRAANQVFTKEKPRNTYQYDY
ncbi:MAG: hypothetical protein P1U34_07980 [Coxiellaceae bacterium]|nr:hypothetical protein [Coxiellaceae bacterium]